MFYSLIHSFRQKLNSTILQALASYGAAGNQTFYLAHSNVLHHMSYVSDNVLINNGNNVLCIFKTNKEFGHNQMLSWLYCMMDENVIFLCLNFSQFNSMYYWCTSDAIIKCKESLEELCFSVYFGSVCCILLQSVKQSLNSTAGMVIF